MHVFQTKIAWLVRLNGAQNLVELLKFDIIQLCGECIWISFTILDSSNVSFSFPPFTVINDWRTDAAFLYEIGFSFPTSTMSTKSCIASLSPNSKICEVLPQGGSFILRIHKQTNNYNHKGTIKKNKCTKTFLIGIYVRTKLHHIWASFWFLVKIIQIIDFGPPILRLPCSYVVLLIFRPCFISQAQALRWMRHIKSEEISRQNELIFY